MTIFVENASNNDINLENMLKGIGYHIIKGDMGKRAPPPLSSPHYSQLHHLTKIKLGKILFFENSKLICSLIGLQFLEFQNNFTVI